MNNLERHEEALSAFTHSTILDPDDSYAWSMKGWAHAALDQNENALKAYDRAIEIDPDEEFPWVEKAEQLMALGRHRDAFEAAKRASEINPSQSEAWELRQAALEHMEADARDSLMAEVRRHAPGT